MKKIKHLLPLLLIALLLMGLLPLGAFAQEDASTDPAEATPTPAAPEDIISSGGVPDDPDAPDEVPPPAETTAPTVTPAPTPTAAPIETPAPTELPEEVPIDTPSPSSEPYGDGIVMGPLNPPEDAIMLFSLNSTTATIAVRACSDSSGTPIKYAGYFYCNGLWVGGNGYPRHILYANDQVAYCLEPGKYLSGGSSVSTSAASVWSSLSTAKREAIKTVLLCGQPGNSGNLSGSFGNQYTATALIIWELVMDCRSSSPPYSVSDNTVINSVCGSGHNSEVRNVYIYCYRRDCLDRHMKHAERGIRFITPSYKELFRIPDGDSIRINREDGTHTDKTCRYIDEYHVEVGSGWDSISHICQFAEQMERCGNTVIPLRSSLPEQCYVFVESTNDIGIVKKGESGYIRIQGTTTSREVNRDIVAKINQSECVTKAQSEAMSAGSMFGWATPAADPANYDEQGKLIKPKHIDRGDAR